VILLAYYAMFGPDYSIGARPRCSRRLGLSRPTQHRDDSTSAEVVLEPGATHWLRHAPAGRMEIGGGRIAG
jgi:hypothetical protein